MAAQVDESHKAEYRQELAQADTALQEFRSAIQLNPNLAGAYYNLGTALLKDSQDAEGAKMLRKYLELTPGAHQRD